MTDRLRRRAGTLAYAAAAAAATAFGAAGHRQAAAATKPLPLIVLGTKLATTSVPDADRRLVWMALGLHLAGDTAMYLEEFSPAGHRKDQFLATAATSFGAGHVAIAALLHRRGARLPARGTLLRLAAMGGSGLTVLRGNPRLFPVLGAYGAVLATVAALGSSRALPAAKRRALTVGGLVFMASDTALVQRRFRASTPTQRTVGEIAVLATYFTAQGLIYPALVDLLSANK